MMICTVCRDSTRWNPIYQAYQEVVFNKMRESNSALAAGLVDTTFFRIFPVGEKAAASCLPTCRYHRSDCWQSHQAMFHIYYRWHRPSRSPWGLDKDPHNRRGPRRSQSPAWTGRSTAQSGPHRRRCRAEPVEPARIFSSSKKKNKALGKFNCNSTNIKPTEYTPTKERAYFELVW